MLGVLRGTKELGVEATDTISTGAHAIVKGASEVGGDLGKAAKEACDSKSGQAKAQCMNEAKAAYQREQAVDDSVTRRSSQGQNTGAQR